MTRRSLFACAVLFSLFALLATAGRQPARARPERADAYVLIQKINDLRAANGLAPYAVNDILMRIAQAHTEYQASIGQTTHYSADGSRPFQRALAAGFPVAGDLTLGGWFSENTWAGYNLTEDQAIQNWLGDAPHTNTMLSPNLTEVGAGVAYAGNIVYYTVDAGRSTGGAVPVAPTTGGGTTMGGGPIPVPIVVSQTPIIPNTPGPDGRTTHLVQRGETLWALALAYGVKVDDLLRLNGLAEGAVIYEGQTLVVRGPYTATPVTPSPTTTRVPSPTPIPSRTPTATVTASPVVVTEPPTAASSPERTGLIVGEILLLALIAAGLFTWLAGRQKLDR